MMSVGGYFFFVFKQKTAYEMRISDWSSDVCSSDLKCLWRFLGQIMADAAVDLAMGVTARKFPGIGVRLGMRRAVCVAFQRDRRDADRRRCGQASFQRIKSGIAGRQA